MIRTAIKSFKGLIALAVIAIGFFVYVLPKVQTGGNSSADNGEFVIVERVVDGDTFKLSNGERVRLLGIDTPELYDSEKLDKDAQISGKDKETIRKLGQRASDYVKKFVEGKKVKLIKEPNHEDKDKYGRLLRYVYLEDETFVNAKIIQDGYAYVYDKFPLSKLDEFKKLFREARENKRGLWEND